MLEEMCKIWLINLIITILSVFPHCYVYFDRELFRLCCQFSPDVQALRKFFKLRSELVIVKLSILRLVRTVACLDFLFLTKMATDRIDFIL